MVTHVVTIHLPVHSRKEEGLLHTQLAQIQARAESACHVWWSHLPDPWAGAELHNQGAPCHSHPVYTPNLKCPPCAYSGVGRYWQVPVAPAWVPSGARGHPEERSSLSPAGARTPWSSQQQPLPTGRTGQQRGKPTLTLRLNWEDVAVSWVRPVLLSLACLCDSVFGAGAMGETGP